MLDEERGQLFIGDYMTEGAVFAFVPGGSLRDYLATAESLAGWLDPATRILTAHRVTPPGAPILGHADLLDLRRTLRAIRAGERSASGTFPRVFRVNAGIELHSDFAWAEDWD